MAAFQARGAGAAEGCQDKPVNKLSCDKTMRAEAYAEVSEDLQRLLKYAASGSGPRAAPNPPEVAHVIQAIIASNGTPLFVHQQLARTILEG